MTKVVTAEYDADANVLRLDEKLEGVGDHEKVTVMVNTPSQPAEPSWKSARGILSKEEGEDLQRAVDELFPPWDADE
jgi:hypothetical protein